MKSVPFCGTLWSFWRLLSLLQFVDEKKRSQIVIKFYFIKYSLISKNTQNYFGSYHLWTKFELFLKLRKLLLNKIFCQSLGHFVGLSGHPEGCFHFFSLWMKRRGLSLVPTSLVEESLTSSAATYYSVNLVLPFWQKNNVISKKIGRCFDTYLSYFVIC